jgi:hypothetical protein
MAAKKAAKKQAAKKTASKRPVSKWAASGNRKNVEAAPPGYERIDGSRLIVTTRSAAAIAAAGVVPAGKLQAGIRKASEQISEVLQQLADAASASYEITEIELAASFSADGKFMGFGVGGEMSITFKVRPTP